MIKKFRALLLSSLTAITLLVPAIAMPAMVHAADSINTGLTCGVNLQFKPDGSACTPTTGDPTTKVNDIIKLVINIFSVVVGLIAVIMIIIGGIRFVLSGGDSANVTSARNTILYAIVGLVIVALAQILVRYVLTRVTNG